MKSKEALSLDQDGVVILRRWMPVQIGPTKKFLADLPDRFRGQSKLYPSVGYVPLELDRTPRNEPIGSRREAISYAVHKGRIVRRGAKEVLSRVSSDVYGNTGRDNKQVWIDMTRDTLRCGDLLDRYSDILFKPEGVSTRVSKAVGLWELIQKYQKVVHIDDNPMDVLTIAPVLPLVKFVILPDLSGWYLLHGVDLSKHPNVRIARTFEEAVNTWGANQS